jgi:hypothetical protein
MTQRQTYIRLLYAAYDANLAVDYYDLKSDDDKSVEAFEELQRVASDADMALISHILGKR